MNHVAGGCLCGDVRVTATGEPSRVGISTASIAASWCDFPLIRDFSGEVGEDRGEPRVFGCVRPVYAELRIIDDPAGVLAAAPFFR